MKNLIVTVFFLSTILGCAPDSSSLTPAVGACSGLPIKGDWVDTYGKQFVINYACQGYSIRCPGSFQASNVTATGFDLDRISMGLGAECIDNSATACNYSMPDGDTLILDCGNGPIPFMRAN